ncbi:hypothetical protein GCM10011572_48310 [Pseudoduganella buxea]|uniref:Uncharacterized protein n=1 Tax=Pseudoduganella buxea TaxID=1949069 RepID=A0ABQ1LC76_9BURK|nr:hypothetical protein GCM10011572_48310 [Pseudoduganella buxea]
MAAARGDRSDSRDSAAGTPTAAVIKVRRVREMVMGSVAKRQETDILRPEAGEVTSMVDRPVFPLSAEALDERVVIAVSSA